MTRKSLILIIISAALTSLSFHPLNLYFLLWFSLVPLLWAIEEMDPSSVFKSGVLFGTVFSLLSLFWIAFLQIEATIKLIMLFGLLLLFLYYGLYYGTGLLIAKRIGIWFLPFILTGLEFIRSIGELGFPWLVFGYSQARYPVIIQQASIFGVYGVSFWLILVNVALFKLIRLKRIKNLVILLFAFFIPLIYGVLRLKEPVGETILVGVIQPDIDPNLKFTKAMRDETFERLISLSETANQYSKKEFGENLDLIIWPETAVPVFITFPGKYQNLIFSFVDRTKIPLLTGTPIYESKEHSIYNGAILIEPNKEITQQYRKIHLVPFGEHIPFDQQFTFLKKIDVGGGKYTPGTLYTVFELDKVKFSCLICFESIFPELSRRFVKNGAELLVNITNDGWFGRISGPQQHNDMAILRTVENGKPLARSSNTGISMIVNKYGMVLQQTPLFTRAVLVEKIVFDKEKTVYNILGDILPVVSLILTTVLLGFWFFNRMRGS